MIKNIFCTVFLVFLIFENSHAQSLDSFINSGLKNSPLLYDFNNQQLSGKLDSLLLLASFKPQINQLTQAVHYPTGSEWGYDAAITNGGNYAALLNITQTLFSKKRINGQLQTIDLLNQTLKLNAKITVLDLKKSISAQYLTAYADFVQYNFNKSILQQLTNEQSTIKALVDKGVYLVTDFMNLQIMIKAQGITWPIMTILF